MAVTPVEVADLRPAFDAAIAAASNAQAEILGGWPNTNNIEWSSALNDFQAAFNLRPVRDFWDTLMLGEQRKLELTEENVIDLVSTLGITPVSVLYYAIGKAAVGKIPGYFGNVLLTAAEVPGMREQLQRAMAEEPRDVQVKRGAQLLRAGRTRCESEVAQILEAWPAVLQSVEDRGAGLLSVGIQAP